MDTKVGRSLLSRGKLALWALAVALCAVGLAACGESSSSSSGSTTSAGGSGGSDNEGQVAIGNVGTPDELISIKDVCGEKPIKVAYADGFGGNAWRQVTRAEFEREARECPNIEEVSYTDGQGNPQKAISDMQGLVAKGTNVIVLFADSGKAMLPTVKQASAAGITVVPFLTPVGGEAGKDFLDVISDEAVHNGYLRAKWVAEALHGKGKVVYLGGTPGNPVSELEFEGAEKAWAEFPGIEVLEDHPVTTNYDPADTQKAVAGLLAKYGEIDGIAATAGPTAAGAFRALQAAGKELVPWASDDLNEIACNWEELKGSNPNFQIATTSGRNWLIGDALRKGVATVEGTADPEPSIVNLDLYEDSLDPKKQPKCDKELPPTGITSAQLTTAEQNEILK